ncbi:helix-turn-helix domain-containing protein [Lysobacter brunescens]|uniref:Helix-turn-helix domain-containing protein n=1 Tax=Lysobacter brunescens TaxID=262323 RepID=A0ABW2YEK6_9GAMM
MTSEAQQIIGACVRLFRERAGLTQEGLAMKAGISYQYLSGIETGRENFTIGVLEAICAGLGVSIRTLIPTAYDNASGHFAPLVNPSFFRCGVPLPEGLSFEHLRNVLNRTQSVIHRINRNMVAESGETLQNLIQGNNFSGLVSNILADSFHYCSPYKHNHDQRYPDLINPWANNGASGGLEVKTTLRIGKGGESHNGHDGWHVVACYNFTDNGDIQFVHVMFAWLNGHMHDAPDWKYVGSRVNEETGSRRTETFNTTPEGNLKLRDGSAYLDPTKVLFNRWKHPPDRVPPTWSIWSD